MGTICIVMNTRRPDRPIVNYTNFQYGSLCTWNDRFFCADSSGILEHSETADDDNGTAISATMIFSSTDFGEPQRKRVRGASLRYRADQKMRISWLADKKNESAQQSLPEVHDGTFQTLRIKGDRSAEGTYFEFAVSNYKGGDFLLDELDVDLQNLQIGKSRR